MFLDVVKAFSYLEIAVADGVLEYGMPESLVCMTGCMVLDQDISLHELVEELLNCGFACEFE